MADQPGRERRRKVAAATNALRDLRVELAVLNHRVGNQVELKDLDFDCLDDFADPLLALGTAPTAFGRAASENRSTYMQALELGRHIVGENVIPPGQSGFIHQVGNAGQADPHMGDQADLFRSFTYKPMRLQ